MKVETEYRYNHQKLRFFLPVSEPCQHTGSHTAIQFRDKFSLVMRYHGKDPQEIAATNQSQLPELQY